MVPEERDEQVRRAVLEEAAQCETRSEIEEVAPQLADPETTVNVRSPKDLRQLKERQEARHPIVLGEPRVRARSESATRSRG
jgi:hypothetical protein